MDESHSSRNFIWVPATKNADLRKASRPHELIPGAAVNIRKSRRILIVGSPGAGKSTCADKLGRSLGLPVVKLDDIYWKPGWERPEANEWQAQLAQIAAGEEWIIDGNNADTLPQRLLRANIVLVLRFARLRCMYSVMKRDLKRCAGSRNDLPLGLLSTDRPTRGLIFWRYTWNFQRLILPGIIKHINKSNVATVTFLSRNELAIVLADIENYAVKNKGSGNGPQQE